MNRDDEWKSYDKKQDKIKMMKMKINNMTRTMNVILVMTLIMKKNMIDNSNYSWMKVIENNFD